ncbi:MAG: Alpha-(1,3)-fucosyltransferase FucT [Syntrophomonadaceae bacterium]|nr:Alpha-(1,3)-fucosyltransferase FucT [Bacillota bacterium]
MLNRDNCLSAFHELRNSLSEKGIRVHTADYLVNRQLGAEYNIYYSFGILTNYDKLAKRGDVILGSFYIMEPPVNGPQLYRELSSLTKCFDEVYIHNTEGMGYERYFSHQSNLRKLFLPQAENGVIEPLWNNKDRGFLATIISNKTALPYLQLRRGQNPMSLQILLNKGSKGSELYSERIRALLALQNFGNVDLYGYGWDTSLYQILRNIPGSQKFPYMYWKNRKALRAIYKGQVKSKYETLSQYRFALCFENSVMPGYIPEKIFDCFFAGTVPIYLGAPDVENYIPKNCFIDMRDFDNYGELHAYLLGLSGDDISSLREAAREYLSSAQYLPFTKEKFVEQFEMDLMKTLERNGINMLSLQDAK